MVHEYVIDGITVRTGDIICTTDGDGKGGFWSVIGKLIPGVVDHVAIYVGPGGRCVEAGAKGRVISFEARGNTWDARKMSRARGRLIDVLHGVAFPLKRKRLGKEGEARIRQGVARYCLRQVGKPYNLNFLNSSTEKAFYCSQLAYKAYLKYGINLNSNKGVPHIPGTERIIFPQEVFKGCANITA